MISLIQEETCHVLFTGDVHYTGSIERLQTAPPSSTEQPSCPVCLGIPEFDKGNLCVNPIMLMALI